MKKRIAIILVAIIASVLTVVSLGGCNDKQETDDLIWTNDNAIYAHVKAVFEREILKDVEGAFASLRFHKVYVTEKI